mgnify:CR=1 FL=1
MRNPITTPEKWLCERCFETQPELSPAWEYFRPEYPDSFADMICHACLEALFDEGKSAQIGQMLYA